MDPKSATNSLAYREHVVQKPFLIIFRRVIKPMLNLFTDAPVPQKQKERAF